MQLFFSCKRSVSSHLSLTINNIPVAQTNPQKHLGMQLDKKLNFEVHLKKVESKVNKTIGIIYKISFHDQHFFQFTRHSLGLT